MSDLGARIRALREWRDLSQKGLADLAGLKRGAIAHYEQGKHQLSLGALVRLADALGTTTDALLGRTA